MKIKLLLFLFVFTFIASAQNISIPDPVFKDLLLISYTNYNSDPNNFVVYPRIDANQDGEISFTEALAVEGLDLGYSNITNLQGLQYFTNVKKISSYYADFPSFYQPTLVNLEQLSLLNSVGSSSTTIVDLSPHLNLKKFQCNSSSLTSLDLSANTQLRDLDLYCPALTSLNLSNLSNLKNLSYLGALSTTDLSDAVNLLSLTCIGSTPNYTINQENLLTSIDLTNQNLLISLDLTGNAISSLDLSNCPNLETLRISNNGIETLILDNVNYVRQFFCSDNLLTSLNVDNMFNLKNFDCSNNQLSSLSTQNGIIEEYIYFSGNPDLESVCCDANEVVYMQNLCNQYDNNSAIVNSNCESATGRIAMYPNPVNDVLHLTATEGISKVEIYSINGVQVMSSNAVSDSIEMNTLNSGMYFLKVFTNQEVYTMKFIKN
ncbi:T9SS type A sorting domain-containing protein [Flavobacterium sp.]|jgi:Leucine-rich repeat (LRR) protein|uniref:T9SS type A sorting domain-containing protein n=1 Tax=Flavobacterium sp. TaxID=239 RepID=UPI0037845AD7